MRISLVLICIGWLVIVKAYGQQEKEVRLTSYVNPFIGTGPVDGNSLSGNNYPGATVPFGMVQLSPDTKDIPDWNAASGYDYNDPTIAGFSHTHLSGTGVAEFFDLLVMPMTGERHTQAGDVNDSSTGYRSKFSHDKEQAKPGYYKVQLLDYDITAELTATTRAGFHRYTFPEQTHEGYILLDLNHTLNKGAWGTKIIQSQIRVLNDHTIEGFRVLTGWAKMRKVYFRAEFSKPIVRNLIIDGEYEYENERVVNGNNLRAIFDFDVTDGQPVLMKIGLSPVSTANAQENLSSEIADWNFDGIVAAADALWEKELRKIVVEGSEKKKTVFYTSLYHAFLQPNLMSDANGDYVATDYVTRNNKEAPFYSTFSLWDTYRAAHPLYTIVQQRRSTDFVNSLLSQYDAYGYLPIWQLWGQENYCMIGNHAIPVIVDAIFKGLPGIDIERAYEAVKNSSVTTHLNSPFKLWDQYQYMPEDLQTQSVSITLEMAYDDWCVAQLAKKLGKTSDYEYFTKRSLYYKNIYDTKSAFFRGKNSDGKWLEPFDPLEYGANGGNPFTEGNAWQYFWYVPHDIEGLIELTGGKSNFSQKLDTFFTLETAADATNHNASGFIGQYAHGNEPSHHVSYLYNYVGQPWKTQHYVSEIVNRLYTDNHAGYPGNEDCGQMSSWYVFSALGFYPVNPADGVYAIGSPFFSEATIQLENGNRFRIKTKKKSEEDIYIQSAKLNGKPLNVPFLKHENIIKGGELEFILGKSPNKKWGTSPITRSLY
ncbi:glycoside hydrolase family 92 protein [Sphingobacterium sp. DN00404]|uniref:Glycoside hydrolase family 92 protein n=1 Tax=Sphingobacterium micropteri TaxID=2763501 RepID=A0ABR7YKY4_9SPHI|nr:GH92 family glycosyl hydrolase [Sphingobacterium micropteri]MBD1431978.1 glycoside hydrolase family 92 protein [Sphingobacterium micropteri]